MHAMSQTVMGGVDEVTLAMAALEGVGVFDGRGDVAAAERWQHMEARTMAALKSVGIFKTRDNFLHDADIERLYFDICKDYALYVDVQQNVVDPEVRALFSTAIVDNMRDRINCVSN